MNSRILSPRHIKRDIVRLRYVKRRVTWIKAESFSFKGLMIKETDDFLRVRGHDTLFKNSRPRKEEVHL